jgi:hypothetical protein
MERFDWSNYNAHDTPTFVLTHRFSMREGDAYVLAQRQYYVSRGYNVMQAVGGFLPVEEGTVVVYTNRTSTDQVTGFGGGTKRVRFRQPGCGSGGSRSWSGHHRTRIVLTGVV